MDDFPFLLNLNYKMNDFEIKPPRSLRNLKEITNEKYDLTYNELVYYTDEGEEKDLITEQDYAELLDYATENNLNQIEIIVKKNEKNTSQKRKESLRKKSSMKNEYEGETYSKKQSKLHSIIDTDENENSQNSNSENDSDNENNNEKGGGNGDEEVGMQCDYDYFGDTRNRKAMYDEGYNKQKKGFKEDKRIGYIKEKKQRQRDEDLKNNQMDECEEEEDKKIERKRKRNKKQMDENDEEYGNNCTEPVAKNNKKKKKPKKDKVRF